jgi:hypothetical protein
MGWLLIYYIQTTPIVGKDVNSGRWDDVMYDQLRLKARNPVQHLPNPEG